MKIMIDKDLLATLKKHIQDIDGTDFEVPSKVGNKIVSFGEDMKSANEFIGALQVLSIALKKCINKAHLVDGAENLDVLKENTVLSIREIISNCSFMGNALFDASLCIELGSESVEFSISTPESFLEKYDFESIVGYFEDKQEEIKQNLALISGKISGDMAMDSSSHNTYTHSIDAVFNRVKI